MKEWILVIDGGASKTVARLENLNTGQQFSQTSGPASLTQDLYQACANLQQLTDELLAKARVSPSNTQIVCGLAGAGDQDKVERCQSTLKKYTNLFITTDACISLYGANLGEPVIVAAIGTGSVVMRLDKQGNIFQSGGWGFPIGDEGGGAKMGFHTVQHLLKAIDTKLLHHSPLLVEISKVTGNNKSSLLPWLSRAKAADYARLAPMVLKHMDQCPIAASILDDAVQAIEELVKSQQQADPLPLVFLGGLGETLKSNMISGIRANIIPAKGDALSGASLLAQRLIKGESG